MIKANEESDIYDIFYLAAILIGKSAAHTGRPSPGQDRILEALLEKDSVNQYELLDKLNLRAGSLSELLSKIEHRGLIYRTKDENDKRSTVISLTETGYVEAQKVKKLQEIKHVQIFSALNDDERTALKSILLKLIGNWEVKINEARRNHSREHVDLPHYGREGFSGDSKHSENDNTENVKRPHGHGGRGNKW